MLEFSLLLSVYNKEKSEHLKECFESIAVQTVAPTEIILVEDGPLTDELYAEIEKVRHHFPCLKTIPLEKNVGLGKALNIGMDACKYEIIARMDTDDVCVKNRFELQLSFLEKHPEIDVIGAWIDEFVGNVGNVVSTRRVPETNQEIYQFGQRRNPVNHPVAMFRKKSVETAGKYQSFSLFEDYYLWIRMLQCDSQFYNIQQPLLYFRRSSDLFKRRGGFAYVVKEIRFQQMLYKMRYISKPLMLKNIMIRFCVRICPNWLRDMFYLKCLR